VACQAQGEAAQVVHPQRAVQEPRARQQVQGVARNRLLPRGIGRVDERQEVARVHAHARRASIMLRIARHNRGQG